MGMPSGWSRKDEPEPIDTGSIDAFEEALPGDPGSVGPGAGWTAKDTRELLGRDLPTFTAFVAERARSSVGGGALRFLLPQTDPSLVTWNRRGGWRSDWPSLDPCIAFATDWKGGLYVLMTKTRRADGEPAIGRLDAVTGELAGLDASDAQFLGEVLARGWRDELDADRLDAWRAAGNAVPRFDQVVVPKQPLILGGSDDIAEMELSFLVVSVSFGGQIREQVKNLPAGTRITGVSLE
jgi:hypothetical protein